MTRIVEYVSIMIMRSFENQTNDSITTMEITAQRLFHLVRDICSSLAGKAPTGRRALLLFEHSFIILKGIIFIFTNSISIYWSCFKAFVGILMILNGVYDKYFWIRF